VVADFEAFSMLLTFTPSEKAGFFIAYLFEEGR